MYGQKKILGYVSIY